MALTPRLELRQRQGLALNSEMRLALSVLRMNAQDLEDAVVREAAENPYLRVRRRPTALSDTGIPVDSLLAEAESLPASLARQLGQMALPPRVAGAAALLVSELREDGMLDTGLDELAAESGFEPAELDAALTALQRCEPAGVGARNLPECLRLQLVDQGLSPAEAALTVQHLRLFAAGDRAAICRQLGLSEDEARKRADMVRGLSPRPVAARDAAPVLMRADLTVTRDPQGTMSVALERRSLPEVVIDETLMRDAAAKGFATELLTRARTLVAALERRGRTLLRVGEWLVANQPGFFVAGPVALKPATRAALAADLGLHPSTVGRALSDKIIAVEGRLWPLTIFFSAAIPGASGVVSARRVQRRIVDMVGAEDPGKPLSDAAIVALLRSEGVDIARRTVAKYREGLRIPSSAARRRQAVARLRR